jgi:pyruvate,orthophosphate dikinase
MSLIYHFGDTCSIQGHDKDLLGNKGANLVEMARLGFNVPPGFVISSDLCKYYYANNKTLPKNFKDDLKLAVQKLQQANNKSFGDSNNPLLVSIRSGASVSMPGMMETILNVGLNDDTCEGLAKKINTSFALDSYRRFLQMYGSVALDIPGYFFEQHISNFDYKEASVDKLKRIIEAFKLVIQTHSKHYNSLPDVYAQLEKSIIAVLNSWTFEKAVTYRKIYNISENLGTAIVVQAMVFGNINDRSGTGVVFSRNPVNGNKELYGEFLLQAQGEDVVSGTHTPKSIADLDDSDGIYNEMPEVYKDLQLVVARLEDHFLDMQDVEFTVEDGKLYILQTRSGKRSVSAAIKIAVDMVKENKITKEEAISRISPESLSQLMHLFVDYSKPLKIIGKGLPASPGSACGIIAFTSEEAETISSYAPTILVRQDTSPEDIKGMHFASGILTSKGGMTSHAAVVARGMGKPCISGANINIDIHNRTVAIGGMIIHGSDYITIDGSTGNIILGKTELINQEFSNEFEILMSWVDEFRKLKVRANAENVLDVQTALRFGAEGIGLCRTEHMLFEQERLNLIRQIVLADGLDQRLKYINQLFKLHKSDFKEIFSLLDSQSINVRLFDPPLHEFLPKDDFETIAHALNISEEILAKKFKQIEEKNPMLGHRGCRLGITYPELYEMQVKAIFEAVIEVQQEKNISFGLEIMLPFISTTQELDILTALIHNQAKQVQTALNQNISYKIGTMIELPRAALLADEIAKYVDYFSFGTNDLTQTTYGLSRDDMAYFAATYKDQGIFKEDPFVFLDEEGVGKLIKIACKKGKAANPKLSLSICGEHGGNPKSIAFCNDIGLNYVSCSPFRVIIAKLAAAQANINLK